MEEKMEESRLKQKMNKDNQKKGSLKSLLVIILTSLVILLSLSTISAITIKNAETDPSEIAPGDVAKVFIEIENIFDEDVTNVNIVLDLGGSVPIAPYQGSSEENIDKIGEGDEEKFNFNIIALPDAVPGIYKVPVRISYEINGTRETKNGTIGIIINSPPQLRISVEGYLIKGQEGRIEIRMVNNGLSDLKFVSFEVSQPVSGATINSPLYEYLGNIGSDDFETVEFSIFTKDVSPSTISIPVKINYKDSTNKDFNQSEILNVRVYSSDEAKNLGLIPKQSYTVYFIIIIVLVGYIIYRIRKKMKRKKALGA